MGFTAANGIILAEGFQVKNTTFSSEDETWTQPGGETKNRTGIIITKWQSI